VLGPVWIELFAVVVGVGEEVEKVGMVEGVGVVEEVGVVEGSEGVVVG
jgi:hypothetical protein